MMENNITNSPVLLDTYLKKWQRIVNLTTELLHVPVGLIMQAHEKEIEVLLTSETEDNPYEQGESIERNSGLYCETVMKTSKKLLVHDAQKEEKWRDSRVKAHHMIYYLGFPILWPDGETFGTLCVLDNKDNQTATSNQKVMAEFRDIIESDLVLIRKDEELSQNEQNFKIFFEEASEAKLIINPINGSTSYANREAIKLFKLNAAEALDGVFPFSFSPPFQSDGESSDKRYMKCIEIALQEGFSQFEFLHELRDKEQLLCSIRLRRVVYNGDKALLVSVKDITERKEHELQIIETNTRYLALFDNMVSGFAEHEIITDEKGTPIDYRFLFTNSTFEMLTGMKNVVGKTIVELDSSIDKNKWIAIYGEVALTGVSQSFEEYYQTIDKYFRVYVFSYKKGHFATLFDDISLQKAQTEKIKEENIFANTALDLSKSGSFYMDFEAFSDRVFVDKRTINLIGLVLPEGVDYITLNQWDEIVLNTNREAATRKLENMYKQIHNPEAEQTEQLWELKRPIDNGIVWLNVRSIIQRNKKGEPRYINAVVQDVSTTIHTQLSIQKQKNMSDLLMKISSTYIDVSSDEVDQVINNSLGEFGTFISADRVYVFDYNFTEQVCNNTFEWCESKVESVFDQLQNFPLHLIEQVVEAHKKDEPFVIEDVNNFGDEEIRAMLNAQGVKSMLTIPMFNGSQVIGFFGMDFVKEYKVFSDWELVHFRVFVELLTNIQARALYEVEQSRSKDRLETLIRVSEFEIKDRYSFIKYAQEEAQNLTESKLGYIFFYNEGTQEFLLNAWSQNVMKECETEELIIKANLQETGLWGEVVRQRQPIIMNDFTKQHPKLKGVPNGHIKLERFMSVPVFSDNKIVAVVGVANKKADYTQMDVQQLSLMMDSVWKMLDRFEAQLKIKKSQQNLKLILDTIPMGIAIGDRKINKQILMNKTMLEMMEIEEEMAEDFDITTLYSDKSDKDAIILALNQGKSIFARDYKYVTSKTKREFWAQTSAFRKEYFDRDTTLVCLYDSTKMKELQMSLEHAKEEAESANTAKSRFLATMSHEIRTPMNSIIGFSELLGKRISDPIQKDYLESIRIGGTSLLAMINDILDYSKIEAEKFVLHLAPVNLCTLLEEITTMFKVRTEQKGLFFRVMLSPNIPEYLLLDELRLKQVLINLVSNAVKFTTTGGVTIVVQNIQTTVINSSLVVKIIDTGIGIAKEEHHKVFEAFKQREEQDNRKFGGTGLGLSISHSLVQLMGSEIHLESEEGSGSTFLFTLKEVPIVLENEADNSTVVDLLNVKFDNATLLIINKNERNRKVFTGLLSGKGLQFIEAEDIAHGIALTEQRKPTITCIDMHEFQTVDKAQVMKLKESSIKNNIPVIAITASEHEAEIVDISDYGYDGFIAKPLNEESLVGCLITHIPYHVIPDKRDGDKDRQTNEELEALLEDMECVQLIKEGCANAFEEYGKKPSTRNLKKLATILLQLGKGTTCQNIEKIGVMLLRANELFDTNKIEELMGLLKKALSK